MNIMDISQDALILIFGTIGLTLLSIFSGLLFNGIDRKLFAVIKKEKNQSIIQPFKDIKQLFSEKSTIPTNSVPWIFNLMPILSLAISVSILLFLPLGGIQSLVPSGGDIILIFYLLIMAPILIIIGNFSTGKTTITKEAHKDMENLIAYSLPLVVIILSIVWVLTQAELTEVFSISTIAGLTTNLAVWNYIEGPLGYIGFIILLSVFVFVITSDIARLDINPLLEKNKSEKYTISGYTGRNLGLVYIGDSVRTIVAASLIVTLFFPYNLTNIIDISGGYMGYAIDFVFFLVKIFLVTIVSFTTIRLIKSRLKTEQIAFKYLVQLTLASLVGLILVMWDGTLMTLIS